MRKDKNNELSSVLHDQTQRSWGQFSDQYPDATKAFTSTQLSDFKQIIGLSDFVLNSALQSPESVCHLVISNDAYSHSTPDYLTMLSKLTINCQSESDLHNVLRLFRLKEMVRIAFADFILNISLDESLKRLSALADALITSALNWLTLFCQEKWGVPQSVAGEEQKLLVYGMGKLGGKELNFSSDIDLIFVYPEAGETVGCRRTMENQQFFTRLGQKLITALHQKTVDGFVYRVDMRLRPYGESGPLVITFNAIEDYYQEQGRDWERYAMLKARLIGNSQYHQHLTNMLRPFVYRRYIDFSVIESLRRMKMMISQEVRRKKLINNIKLGAGGIREIEFVVQVFQLIRGGRVKALQQRNLLSVLPELVNVGEISQSSSDILKKAYRFLRRVENIIQALADQQSQTLPDEKINQARIIHVLQFPSWQSFLDCLQEHMKAVHQEFLQLIGEENPNHEAQDEYWVTLWHSQWSDEESIKWIEQIENPWQADKIWSLIGNFRTDIGKWSIGNRGRQVLDKLMPLLLWHLQNQPDVEIILKRVLVVFNKIATRTAYIELLFENEGALKHLLHLCQASEWVTDNIAKYPILLDELIDPKLLNNLPQLSSYALELREGMLRIPEDDLEAQMDTLRQFKQAQQLRIAAADISEILPLTEVSNHLTALAEAIIEEVIGLAWQQMVDRYGAPQSTVGENHKGFAVIGYGKMGGIELGYGSDLDLVFLHSSPQGDVTTGERQVPASQFYIKLAQRIMHIFNARMSSGILYELDMRLRPSGNAGLLVIHIATFEKYQLEDAWTWEHQALVRARIIFGSQVIRKHFNAIRQSVLSLKRDPSQLKADVAKMRNKMRQHLDQSETTFMDIKQGKGGLVDIEFLAQYWVLNHSYQYGIVGQFSDNIRIFEQLKNVGIIDEFQQKLLTTAYCRLRDKGHRATLQNEALLISNKEFSDYTQVIAQLWEKCLA